MEPVVCDEFISEFNDHFGFEMLNDFSEAKSTSCNYDITETLDISMNMTNGT